MSNISKKGIKTSMLITIITYWGGSYLVCNSSLLVAYPNISYVDVVVGLLAFFGIWKACNLMQAFYRWYNGIENVS
ncbi:TPA: hypothetical protein SMI40_002001 [Serratia liquefaciens]|uniref:hypothetical protein n=1 Tax=Serratia sp. AXJ-M TaxID=2754727 RepID=UPI0029E68D19|nr:hypothetical protein [Serratia liquefaciens]